MNIEIKSCFYKHNITQKHKNTKSSNKSLIKRKEIILQIHNYSINVNKKMNSNEINKKLNLMTMSELKDFCNKIGIIPNIYGRIYIIKDINNYMNV